MAVMTDFTFPYLMFVFAF